MSNHNVAPISVRKKIIPALALAAIAIAGAAPAGAATGKLERAKIEMEEKAKFSVGAGSMAYIAQESPSTGISLDTRLEYGLSPTLAIEGSATTAFSSDVEGDGTTIPMLLDASAKFTGYNTSKVDLYGAAGMSYGAYFGTEELQDGATFGIPLSVGAEMQAKKLNFAPRFTYRPVFGDQLGPEEAQADSWTAVLDVQLPFL